MKFNSLTDMILDSLDSDERVKYIRNVLPVRIQFVCGYTLVAECIVQGTNEAERVAALYFQLKHARNKPLGSNSFYRADNARLWDVKVGSSIISSQLNKVN